MAISNAVRYACGWLLIVCVTACAHSSDLTAGGNQMPRAWSLAVPDVPGTCTPIAGEYRVAGRGQVELGSSLVETRLDAALGYTFPAGSVPSSARISIEEQSSVLSVHFGKPAYRGFSESAKCVNGWWVLATEDQNEYLGDGTTLDYSRRRIELAGASDGALIVHLLVDSEFSSFIVLRDRIAREIWAKHDRITSEDE